MKIGIDIRELSILNNIKCGWYQYTYNLVSNLLANDSDNDYIFLSTFSRGKGFRGDSRIPRKIVRRFPARLSQMLLEQFSIPIELFLGKIDLIHGPCDFIPDSLQCKSIVTIHDLIPLKQSKFMTQQAASTLRKNLHISINRADIIITVSKFTKGEIVELFNIPEEKIRVVYNGIAPIFQPIKDKIKIESIKAKYNVKGPYLLFVGNIEPRKNLETLIHACVRLWNSTIYKYPLLVVGHKDWFYKNVWEVVRKLKAEDAVIFTGVVDNDDLPFLYSGADVFVFPSLAEGFGIPVIEAMACGTPVIAANCTSLPEIVADAGLLVDPLNSEDLAESIHSVLSKISLRQKLIEKGIERAKIFSWERTAMETLGLYQEIGHHRQRNA